MIILGIVTLIRIILNAPDVAAQWIFTVMMIQEILITAKATGNVTVVDSK